MGLDILSDVYNANPTAYGVSLRQFPESCPLKGRRIAVLADMLELGPDSAKMHAGMAEHLDETFDLSFSLRQMRWKPCKRGLEQNET
jgi:UDP-N-acetylmuramoyl-tripeptide--D-alanyl-D-alanine ligase